MDWPKILFCVCLAISNTVSLETSNSKTETIPKEEKINSNHTLLNSTQNTDEILESSPSETIRFQKPVIFRERQKVASPNEEKGPINKKNKAETKSDDKDLTKEANGYSAVLAFTEMPRTFMSDHVIPDLWHVVPEIFPYVKHNEFISSFPIIESQSFVNKPKMSTLQINYSPTGHSDGRNVHPRNREYPEDHSSPNSQGDPEPENHPGRGHTVHTETSHDYGRFLPVNYKSKIEKEAEELVKQKKTQNRTISDRPQQNNREKRQRTTSSSQRYRRPVNTAFFHKGNFDDAYPFPDNHNDQRYTSEKYPKQYYTTEQHYTKEPVTPTTTGGSHGPRQPVTSTESYHPQYSYSSEKYPSQYHGGSQHNDPHHSEHRDTNYRGQNHKHAPYKESYPVNTNYRGQSHKDTHYKEPYPVNTNYRDQNHKDTHYKEPYPVNTNYAGQNHKDPHYKEPYSVDTNYRDQNHKDPHYREPHYGDPNHKSQHQGDSYYRDPNLKDSHHNGKPHIDTYSRELHYTEPYNASPPNAPRQYDSSTEKYVPTYSDAFEKPSSDYPGTTHAPKQYHQSVAPPPLQYHNEEKTFPPPYSTDYSQSNHHSDPLPKEFHVPYSNNPLVEPSVPPSDSTHYEKNSELHAPHSNSPNAKNPLDVVEEKAYYNTFRSLVDLYKSFGFQPFNLGEIPIILPPRFSYGNAFHGNIEVSSPVSGPVSTENFHSNSKTPIYTGNTNLPGDQSYNNYREPYPEPIYNSKEHFSSNPHFEHPSPVGNKNHQYHEQVPYDTNPPPIVSTEHYDAPEISKPGVFNTQVESPKETFLQDGFDTKYHPDSKLTKYAQVGDEKAKGVRIKDYDPKTFFGDPQKKNLYNSAESEFSSSASLPDTPLHNHPVVRQNPYNIKDSYSEEGITTYRPRIYRQKLKIEKIRSDSEERTNSFHSNDQTNGFHSFNIDNSRDANIGKTGDIRPVEPFTVHNNDQHNQYDFPVSGKQMKSQQRRPNSPRKSSRRNKRKKEGQNARKNVHQDEFSYKEPDASIQTENRPKRKGKRSNRRSLKKQKSSSKSQRDHMRAEGSTYHWGMERHKGTDGFFQYANVPGAKAFEYGYRMGGPEHTRERHHRTKGDHSKIKVNWEDGNGDSGDHYWEFNHNSKEDDTEEHTPKSEKKASEE